MRQKIFTLSAMAALLFLAVGCTNDDGVQENGKGDSGKNEEAVAIFESKAPTTETSQDVTRTSITHQVSKGATAYWSPGYCIWVEEDDKSINKSAPATRLDGNPIKGDKSQEEKDAMFKLTRGKYTQPGDKIRYTGTGCINGKSPRKVTIAGTQTQDKPNNADHIGRDGDCGVAVAKEDIHRKYNFTLQHKASYLCFMPYIKDAGLANNIFLTKIVVTSNKNNIAGEYGFDDNGLTGPGALKQITLATKGSGKIEGPWNIANDNFSQVDRPGFSIVDYAYGITYSAFQGFLTFINF